MKLFIQLMDSYDFKYSNNILPSVPFEFITLYMGMTSVLLVVGCPLEFSANIY